MFVNKVYVNRNEQLTVALLNIIQPNQFIFEILLSKLISNKLLITIILFLI